METGNWSTKRSPIPMVDAQIYYFVQHSKVGATNCISTLKNISRAFRLQAFIHLLRLHFKTLRNVNLCFWVFNFFWFHFSDNIRLFGSEQPLSYTTVIESIWLYNVQRILNSLLCLFWVSLTIRNQIIFNNRQFQFYVSNKTVEKWIGMNHSTSVFYAIQLYPRD